MAKQTSDTEFGRTYRYLQANDNSPATSLLQVAQRFGRDGGPAARGSDHSPISKLSLELLQTIFIHTLPESANPNRRTSPLLVSHICSAWRAAAFGLPSLWSALSLSSSGGPPSDRACVNMIKTAQFWFEKAGPIKISLSLKSISGHNRPHVIESILTTHSNRIVKLDLRQIASGSLENFLTLPHGHVDALESLTLDLRFRPYVDKPVTVFQSAPRLRKVIIEYINDEWFVNDNSRLFLPWAQLTHLDIRTSLSYATWRELFRVSIRLERCHFCVWLLKTAVSVRSPEQATIFPNLTAISIQTDSRRSQPLGIEDFSFPALTELDLRHVKINTSWIETSRRTLQFHSLRRLMLTECPISIGDIIAVFKATPVLTEVNFSFNIEVSRDPHGDVSRLWDLLTIPSPHNDPGISFLPRLRILTVWLLTTARQSFLPVECAAMIGSRWNQPPNQDDVETSVARLQRMALHVFSGNFEDMEEIQYVLEDCVDEGLDLCVDKQRSVGPRITQW